MQRGAFSPRDAALKGPRYRNCTNAIPSLQGALR